MDFNSLNYKIDILQAATGKYYISYESISKYLLVLLILSACKVDNKNKTDLVADSKESSNPKTELTIQQKDTVREKSAIGKSYNKYLNEIEEFNNYDSSGGHSIVDSLDENESNGEYSAYGLATLDIFELNEKEGTSINKGEKYIVMLNGKTVVDYIDVEYLSIYKDLVLYGDGVQLNGKIDKELFAFAPYNEDEEEIITEVYKVYRADKETGKIIEVSVKGITIVVDYM